MCVITFFTYNFKHQEKREKKMKYIYAMILLGLGMFANNGYAYNCSGVTQYSNSGSYNTGTIVQNSGSAYQCTVGGWCTVGGPYEPGVGWAWTSAWSGLGTCDGGGSSSSSSGGSSSSSGGGSCASLPTWNSSSVYTGGNQVQLSGTKYQAKWWTQGDNPSQSGQWGVWSNLGACSGGGSSSSGGSSSGGSSSGGTSSGGFSSIVSSAQFNQMFPNRNAFYTYQGLVNATNSYSAFAGTGDTAMRRREAAAALANFSHETGGLFYIREIARPVLCGNSTPCGGCAAGQSYYGRGPIQLSWNFNYCSAGQALGLGSNLWASPDQVATNATTAWQTALWYWMTQNGPGSTPAHNCIASNQGFGCTIRAINGSLECDGGNSAQVQSRINIFSNFKSILGTTSVGADSC